MDFYFVRADNDVLRALAAKLPAGRVFESGRAFVPFIKAALYEQLLAALALTPRRGQSKPLASPLRPEAAPGAV